jgi:hypothetical protein
MPAKGTVLHITYYFEQSPGNKPMRISPAPPISPQMRAVCKNLKRHSKVHATKMQKKEYTKM